MTRGRSSTATLLVASLEDIGKSKRAANRPKDRAVLDVRRATLDEVGSSKKTDPR